MAIVKGQYDRFGNPIPADPGYEIIINADGTQPRQRKRLLLSGGVATDDDQNDATVLTVSAPTAGSITNAMLASEAASTIKGQIVGGSGPPVDMTVAQALAVLGLSGSPVRLADGAFTAQTSQTISFTANQYRRIEISLQLTGGSLATISLTGISASTYNAQYMYTIAGAAPAAIGSIGANSWAPGNVGPLSAKMCIDLPPAPAQKSIRFEVECASGASEVSQWCIGRSTDVTHDPTAIVITMASTNGFLTAWGYPS